jgi:hypothetical protein
VGGGVWGGGGADDVGAGGVVHAVMDVLGFGSG